MQLDEPVLALDLDGPTREAYRRALGRLSFLKKRPRLMLTTYFEGIDDNLDLAVQSGCEAIHVDLVRAPEQLDAVLAALPADDRAVRWASSTVATSGGPIWTRPTRACGGPCARWDRSGSGSRRPARCCTCPSTSTGEEALDPQLKSWLAFARQKLDEIRALADAAGDDAPASAAFAISRAVREGRRASERVRNPAVRARVRRDVDEADAAPAQPVPAARGPATRAVLAAAASDDDDRLVPADRGRRAARAAWRARR